MAYKRYARKNGKVYGPYYYESYREGGKVKKIYIGQKPPASVVPQKKLLSFAVVFFKLSAMPDLMFNSIYSIPGTRPKEMITD